MWQVWTKDSFGIFDDGKNDLVRASLPAFRLRHRLLA